MNSFHKKVGTRSKDGDGRYGVVANVIQDRVLRKGAKVYILRVHGEAESVSVTGISSGGRKIEKHIPLKRLENFRAAWIPDHILSAWYGCHLRFESKPEAQKLASDWVEMWKGIQWFSKDGTEKVRDGEPASVAFSRLNEMSKQ